jgi:hypothetical protein
LGDIIYAYGKISFKVSGHTQTNCYAVESAVYQLNERRDFYYDGETVPYDEPFSNGLMWPHDYGEPEETCGCNCTVTVTIEY